MAACIQPVEQCGSCAADVKVTCGRRGKSKTGCGHGRLKVYRASMNAIQRATRKPLAKAGTVLAASDSGG